MKAFDLESLKSLFQDQRSHIALGKITKLMPAKDRSVLRVMVEIWPERREIVARMTWEMVGPSSGIFGFPVKNDLVLVAFADGDDDHVFVIKRLTSKEDKIPATALTGDLVLKALAGKKAWLTATKIYLSKADTVPTENLVLGQKLKTFITDLNTILKSLVDQISQITVAGNLGYPTSTPNNAAAITAIKTQLDDLMSANITNSAILSDVSYTEK